MPAKRACVTGCSRGLGRALVEWFGDQGWTLSGCGRDAASMKALQSRLGDRGRFIPVDVADDEAVAAFSAEIDEQFGPPDLLVNNAGLINERAPLWEVPADEFSRIVDVNVKGVANCLRHFAPLMIARGRGVMVNLSSGWGRSTSPEVAPYCATKWAIEGLSQAMAQELPRNLAVAALNPGVIATDMLRIAFGEAAAAHDSPEQWAERAGPFLASLDASANGKQLTVP